MYCQWELEFIANCFFAPIPIGRRPHVFRRSRIASIWPMCITTSQYRPSQFWMPFRRVPSLCRLNLLNEISSEDHNRSCAKNNRHISMEYFSLFAINGFNGRMNKIMIWVFVLFLWRQLLQIKFYDFSFLWHRRRTVVAIIAVPS